MTAAPAAAVERGAAVREARWLSEHEQQAWRALLRMHAVITAALNRQLAAAGLSVQDYGVLVALDESESGEMRPFELGRALGLEKSRLSHHLARLVGRGLVARTRCPSDNRGWLVRITPAGREALTTAAPGHVAAVRETFVDRLSPAQLAALVDMAEAVLACEDEVRDDGVPDGRRQR